MMALILNIQKRPLMKNLTPALMTALAGVFLLAACQIPGVANITPDNLPGCWQGESFGVTAKVQITAGSEAQSYTVDGSANGFGQNIPISNLKVKLENGELKPQGVAAVVPVKLKVEGAEIQLSTTAVPISLTLRRCAGAAIPSASPSATSSPVS